jgi:hypothetical protein
MTSQSASTHNNQHFWLDPDHWGIRLIVPVVSVFACIATYAIGIRLSAGIEGSTVAVLLIVPVAIGAAVAAAWGVERVAKQYWHSGRALLVDEAGVTLRQRREEDITIAWDRHVNVLSWRFVVPPRRGHVQRGWLCLACQLLQDEDTISLYTFMSPKEAEDLPYYDVFTRLVPRKELDKSGWLSAGEQARLHNAEADRWYRGGELTREDFVRWIQLIDERVEGWAGGLPKAHHAPEPSEAHDRPPSKGDGKPIQL